MAFNYKTDADRYKKYYQSLEPLLLSPKKRQFTTVIFSFLAISLFGWYAIRPTIQTILYLKRELKDKTKVNQQMEEKISALIEAQASYQNIETDLPLLTQALPNNPNIILLVSALRTLANESEASLSGIQAADIPILAGETPVSTQSAAATENPDQPVKPAVPSGKNKTVEIPVSVTLSGPYFSITSFLDGLVNLRRIVSIESIGFSSGTQDKTQSLAGSKSMQINLKLKTFYQSL